MSFNNLEIRVLRQRLGWSLAEMSRRLGCSTEILLKWESGSTVPDHEVLNQLRYLRNHVEATAEHISQNPLVEKEIESRRVAQLTHRDLLKDS